MFSAPLIPVQASAPSASRKPYTRLFTGTEMVSTTITAMPRPKAAETFLETARKVHMPRKNASARFSTKTEATNRLR